MTLIDTWIFSSQGFYYFGLHPYSFHYKKKNAYQNHIALQLKLKKQLIYELINYTRQLTINMDK